jgi:O-antigen ligase
VSEGVNYQKGELGLNAALRSTNQVPSVIGGGLQLASFTVALFLAFGAYVVVPVVRLPVPFLSDLSLSAPILFFIALEVWSRSSRPTLRSYRKWVVLAGLFIMGAFLSLAGNLVFGRIDYISTGNVLTLVHYIYWIIAFVITVIVTSSTEIAPRLSVVLGVSVAVLAALRLGEAILFSRWGPATYGQITQLLTQNEYGIQFSTFTPFALLLPLVARNRGRWLLSMIGLLLITVTFISNGSRSSWIAIAVGTVVFAVLYFLTQPDKSRLLLILLVLFLLLWVGFLSAPETLLEPINRRFSSFERIESDKSFLFRQVMVQRGQHLFSEHPLLGVGLGRFQQENVIVEVPYRLSRLDVDLFQSASSHNAYVQHLAETGLVGTIPLAILLITLAVNGLRATMGLARRGEIWAIAAYAGFVSMSIHLWTLAGLGSTGPWLIYGLVAGVIERSASLQQEATVSLSERPTM